MANRFGIRDLPIMFRRSGQVATYTHAGTASSIMVIFDNEYLAAEFIDSAVATAEPQALAMTTDVENAVAGDTLVVDGVTYYVTAPEPDGTGVTRLVLSKDSS